MLARLATRIPLAWAWLPARCRDRYTEYLLAWLSTGSYGEMDVGGRDGKERRRRGSRALGNLTVGHHCTPLSLCHQRNSSPDGILNQKLRIVQAFIPCFGRCEPLMPLFGSGDEEGRSTTRPLSQGLVCDRSVIATSPLVMVP